MTAGRTGAVRVVIFGATGMVGQSVLRQCLLDDRISAILLVGRSHADVADPKVTQVVHQDFLDFSSLSTELTGFDACFFCLGVSANGMTEPAYRRVTYFITMAAGRELAELNPDMRFLYISGAGTDSTEHGRLMWARIKGETENAVLALPFHGYALRPGYIQPMHGVRTKNRLYRNLYRLTGWVYPVLTRVAPKYVIASDQLASAMINIAADGSPLRILESVDLVRAAG
ncbi:uncharacterized protein YbjT (DUF2867 family) [Nakamurella sp. UYEF19]|uniref:NAD(P)H-binding protein n=1 Tax=Nakamurella sp. UYEF19 TaxID=1756392 RepID=UPI003391360B